jgi:multidrug efflux pump subunit AcrA (membrane-fusion protein)
VAERGVIQRFQKLARVYRAATDSQPAAALVWLDEANAQSLANAPAISLGEDSIEGRLIRVDQAAGGISGRMEALIEFNDPRGRHPVGSALEATFTATAPREALAVPTSAVIHGAAGSFVFARNGGHFSRVMVTTGAESDGWIEVSDGLYEGDEVVAEAVDALWLIELCALKGGTPCCPVPES